MKPFIYPCFLTEKGSWKVEKMELLLCILDNVQGFLLNFKCWLLEYKVLPVPRKRNDLEEGYKYWYVCIQEFISNSISIRKSQWQIVF